MQIKLICEMFPHATKFISKTWERKVFEISFAQRILYIGTEISTSVEEDQTFHDL